jgi:thiol-disulfide isomerase/thioredoxin
MIIDVNDDISYKQFLNKKKHGNWFVWYYADWCGHCQMMKNEWENLENNNQSSCNLAKVKDSFVKPEDGIQGYPTIKLLKNNNSKVASGKSANAKIIDYTSGRDLKSFNIFLNQNISGKKPKKLSGKKAKKLSGKKPKKLSGKKPKKLSGKKPKKLSGKKPKKLSGKKTNKKKKNVT